MPSITKTVVHLWYDKSNLFILFQQTKKKKKLSFEDIMAELHSTGRLIMKVVDISSNSKMNLVPELKYGL